MSRVCVCVQRANERRAHCTHTRVSYWIDYDYKFNWMPPEHSWNGNPIGQPARPAGESERETERHHKWKQMGMAQTHKRSHRAHTFHMSAVPMRTTAQESEWHCQESERATERQLCRSLSFRRVVFDVLRELFLFPIGVPCASGESGGQCAISNVK